MQQYNTDLIYKQAATNSGQAITYTTITVNRLIVKRASDDESIQVVVRQPLWSRLLARPHCPAMTSNSRQRILQYLKAEVYRIKQIMKDRSLLLIVSETTINA